MFCIPSQIDRIAAPTQSSSLHARQSTLCKECPRHAATAPPPDDTVELKVQRSKQSRKWWIETTNHLKALRSSLVKQKILPPLPSAAVAATGAGENLLPIQLINSTTNNNNVEVVRSQLKVDEFVARNREQASKKKVQQVFPRLRLSRPKPRRPLVRVPVAVTILRFPGDEADYGECGFF